MNSPKEILTTSTALAVAKLLGAFAASLLIGISQTHATQETREFPIPN